MAEFCLPCWNKLNDVNLNEKDVIIAKYTDICEGCSEIKKIVTGFKIKGRIKYKKQILRSEGAHMDTQRD